MTDPIDKSFSLPSSLKKRKDTVFKTRIEDTIIRCGISKRDFYDKIKVSSAYWWRLSWGIDKIPAWLKSKLI